MDLSDKKYLRNCLVRLECNLEIQIDEKLYKDFFAGKIYDLLDYSKTKSKVPIIQKYLIAVLSYLEQPSLYKYYDIFNPSRCIPLIIALDNAVTVLKSNNIIGTEERLRKLIKERTFDEFESTLYEIIVCSKYVTSESCSHVEFIKESHIPSPDIKATINELEYLIECKKPNRHNDAYTKLQSTIYNLFKSAIPKLHKKGFRRIINITFNSNPSKIPTKEVNSAIKTLFSNNNSFHNSNFSISVEESVIRNHSDYLLYPSSSYFYNFYKFKEGGFWHGLIPDVIATYKSPSWIDEVHSDVAICWKVECGDTIWKLKKINHKLIYKALSQLNGDENNTIIHYWFDRDRALGDKQKELRHLIKTILDKGYSFNWFISNETSNIVSPEGRFDFTEHSHFVSTIDDKLTRAPVTNVFLFDEDTASTIGSFGKGVDLPDIDIDDEEWKVKK